MTQPDLIFDGFPKNPFAYGSQNWRLYERLTDGPVYNIEIVNRMHILNSTGRCSDIRKRLHGIGLDLIGKRVNGDGLWEYRIQKVRATA